MGLNQEAQIPVLTQVRGDEDFSGLAAFLPAQHRHNTDFRTNIYSNFTLSAHKRRISKLMRLRAPGDTAGFCPQLLNAEVW